jgi:hypothetical protein
MIHRPEASPKKVGQEIEQPPTGRTAITHSTHQEHIGLQRHFSTPINERP